MNIGQAIKEYRKKKGISQKKLAEMSGLSHTALCRIENDQAFPTKKHITKICDALGITRTYLLFTSLTDEDIPEKNLPIFKALKEPIIKVLENE